MLRCRYHAYPSDTTNPIPQNSCKSTKNLLLCRCHAIPTAGFCPIFARNTANPGAGHPPSGKKYRATLDDIGGHWGTLGDICPPWTPKRENFGHKRRRRRTAAIPTSQTCKFWDQRPHKPGWFCEAENVETLGLTREIVWEMKRTRLKPGAFTFGFEGETSEIPGCNSCRKSWYQKGSLLVFGFQFLFFSLQGSLTTDHLASRK